MTAIAVDVMSGDRDFSSRVIASQKIKIRYPDIDIILVGDKEKIQSVLGAETKNFYIEATDKIVRMDDLPTRAIRRRGTSMRRALRLVAEGNAQAAVSAGNTGALMGLGVLELKVIEGISRPAIASFIPSRSGKDSFCLLDMGANVDCSAKMLYDFALMGLALVRAVKEIDEPSVGLLNIGEEEFKGNKILLEAAELLRNNPDIDFKGNVEGHGIFRGEADVIVCDGFTGNIVLKVTEGLASMIINMIEQAFRENKFSKGCGFFAMPVLRKLKRRMDSRAYNGGCFLGLRGVVVKSHGNADESAFFAAIDYSIRAAKRDLPHIISSSLSISTNDSGVIEQNFSESLVKVS